MIEALKKRMADLERDLARADAKERAELLEHLEQVVLGLEEQGHEVPIWARSRLNDRIDEDVENQFDNMPI